MALATDNTVVVTPIGTVFAMLICVKMLRLQQYWLQHVEMPVCGDHLCSYSHRGNDAMSYHLKGNNAVYVHGRKYM